MDGDNSDDKSNYSADGHKNGEDKDDDWCLDFVKNCKENFCSKRIRLISYRYLFSRQLDL